MSNDKIRQLIGQPEGQQLEYKSVVPLPTIITRTIGAFANTEGGVLILGVQDDLTILGLSEDVPAAAIVEGAISRLNPRPNVKHYPYYYSSEDSNNLEHRLLYIVEVEKSPTSVVAEDNSIFFREGAFSRAKVPVQILPERTIKQHFQCVDKVFEIINQNCKKITESKRAFFKHYKNLLLIIEQSAEILAPDDPKSPSQLHHGRTLLRLIFSSVVDVFEAYLVDLLMQIHLAKPETLKSDSTVTVKEVLNCKTMETFISFAANKRVKSLTRGSEDSFIDAFNFTNFKLKEEIDKVRNFYQIRHIYTHKNGIIDEQFLYKTSVNKQKFNNPYKVGDEHKISLETFCEIITLFVDIVNRLDSESIKKYHLEKYDMEE